MTAVLSTCAVLVSGCTAPAQPQRAEPEGIVARPVDPAFLHGTDRGPIDQLAAAVVTDVQAFWAGEFPRTFHSPWRDLDGGFYSVDTTDARATAPPCSNAAPDVEGNAFFCASVDTIAWDRDALLPVLREHYGEAAVAVVLAHEIGHAVQHRSGTGVGQVKPIVTETMADCYAGSFLRWAVDGRAPHLRVHPDRLDEAMRALITFRDPVGGEQAADDPHGTAFDRVSAFQDGYRDGAGGCSGMSTETRRYTANEVSGRDQRNEPLEPTVRTGTAEVEAYFADLVTRRGHRWHPPASRRPDTIPCRDRGPVAYCGQPRAVVVDDAALADLHYNIGDHSVQTLLASRYALAALADMGRPVTGRTASKQAACLTGAYTGSGLQRAGSSSGALDEAVETALTSDSVARDAAGADPLSGFDRVGAFRDGVLRGTDACGPWQ
jgi:predicted metalloprotease